MAALVDDYRIPQRPRALRFRRPEPEPEPTPRSVRRVGPDQPRYTMESPSVPHPANLEDLLRPEQPDVHWSGVLSAVYDGGRMADYTEDQVEDAAVLRMLLQKSARHPQARELVLRLVPVEPCRRCGRDFLRDTLRRMFCSDRCRRIAAATSPAAGMRPGTGQPCPTLDTCGACGAPLPGGKRRYCDERCGRQARYARDRARTAARQAARAAARMGGEDK